MDIADTAKKILYSSLIVAAFVLFHLSVTFAGKHLSLPYQLKFSEAVGMSVILIGALTFAVSVLGFIREKMWPFSTLGFAVILLGITVFNQIESSPYYMYSTFILPVAITYLLYNLSNNKFLIFTILLQSLLAFACITGDLLKILNISYAFSYFYVIGILSCCFNILCIYKGRFYNAYVRPVFAGYVAYAAFFILSAVNFRFSFSYLNSYELIYGNLAILALLLIMFTIRAIDVNVALSERKKMNKRNAVWIERIGRVCEVVNKQESFDDFCRTAADGIISLIDMDRQDVKNSGKEKVSKIVIVNKNGELKVIDKSDGMENISVLDSTIKRSKDRTLVFGTHFVDIYFFLGDVLQCFLHLEGFKFGFSENIKNILQIAYSYISMSLNNLELKAGIKEIQESLIYSFSDISDAKSENAGDHIRHICEFVKIFCKELGMSKEETEKVTQASMMHDIGKLAIADEIVGKEGKLTKEQYEVMKQHTAFGYNMLSKAKGDILKAASIIAQQHHEKWDGTGYLGLKGEQIHLYSRIVAVADVFDALLSERSYKKAWTIGQVYKYMNDFSGTQFDPMIINIFNKCYKELYNSYKKNYEKTTA